MSRESSLDILIQEWIDNNDIYKMLDLSDLNLNNISYIPNNVIKSSD